MGARPTHPELLDWLAGEFTRSGWNLRHLHRLIVTSSTYRQSSGMREDARAIDPSNRLWWRFAPTRLEAEAVRDSALFVSGLLNLAAGGPSVFPPRPEGMPRPVGGWDTGKDLHAHNRRSIYVFVRRNDPYPMMNALDFPDTHESCSRRGQTTTAPQALTLLNNPLPAAWSQRMAARAIERAGSDASRRIEAAFELVHARKPQPAERDFALTFLARQSRIADPDAALADLCLMLINSNEFVYRF
jgi:hypothetical protein